MIGIIDKHSVPLVFTFNEEEVEYYIEALQQNIEIRSQIMSMFAFEFDGDLEE